ncbi:hypothetical protein [Sulfolobus sp. S-194]|uniref:hypothetical protein n=1 Tax=Sulfolobus sp. S-194 TaxID=2512240 RepID=UPI00143A72C8|nr:hypothetical protein [Sulfolobus sp. S-194]
MIEDKMRNESVKTKGYFLNPYFAEELEKSKNLENLMKFLKSISHKELKKIFRETIYEKMRPS